MNRFTFFDDTDSLSSAATVAESQTDTSVAPVSETPIADQQLRYRCEQTVVVKQESVIKTHAETKREFLVNKIARGNSGNFLYQIKMVDSIIAFYPQSMQDTMNLMNAIDEIKCAAVAQLNTTTGKISAILNMDEIAAKWLEFKTQLADKYSFIRDKATRAEVDKIVEALNHQVTNEHSLITDLNTKMFFDLFFDRYLVGTDDFSSPYSPNFNSQLFNDVPLELTIQPMITLESADMVNLTRLSKLNKTPAFLAQIEARYNQRIKPSVGYKFSSYDFSFRTDISINARENLINEAKMTINEEIKNNVQVLTNYTLKRVEL